MKTILLTTALILSHFLYSQSYKATVVGDGNQLQQSIASNQIELIFPTEILESDIMNAASLYSEYFSVVYNNSTHVVKIHYLNNENITRMVTVRFLFSNHIDQVEMNGNTYETFSFYESFLKE